MSGINKQNGYRGGQHADGPHCYRKKSRPTCRGGCETWVESGIANTLNTFDVGDVRSTTIVVSYEDIDNIHGCRGGGDGMELRRDSRNTESEYERPSACDSDGR